MVLAASVIALIRDEIGNDADFADNIIDFDAALHLDSLENIYVDDDRGESSPLITGLIVWRRRLHDLQTRSFDITTEGSLLSRNQRIRFIERRIKELELLVDSTPKGVNAIVQTPLQAEEGLEAAAELS